ncbi:MAG: N-acetyl-gamma-glutamyl-phosphate reductase [Clostridia bacterium]|nr:N-acetyl-gamma-glutamyl-phosphate reductase [Clostridia bacterium]
MKKVFIDGSAGTTGLRIYERLGQRRDIELIALPKELRKDSSARRDAINSSDVTFLCLPDDAAREAVEMAENGDTVIIDTSTAHRTDPRFAYGFPELGANFFERIRNSKRISVPGCHASGFIALVYPLVKEGILSAGSCLCCTSLTGFSGGGKKMIAEYESGDRSALLSSPRQYGLSQSHKHLKEMTAVTGIETAPAFMPIVADFYSGMEVTVPLFASQIKADAKDIAKIYKNTYTGPIVKFEEKIDEDGFIASGALAGKDTMQISVMGNDERILLIARYDNLGKGASGAAVECFNIAAGAELIQGLVI